MAGIYVDQPSHNLTYTETQQNLMAAHYWFYEFSTNGLTLPNKVLGNK